MRNLAIVLSLVAGLQLWWLATASAEPTEITVRVLGKDSKFIGTSMGGMRIVLRDAATGEILATGLTQGGTGNTKLIMHEDKGRRAQMTDDSAAKFTATLDLDQPRLIEAEAYGPLAQPQAAVRVLSTNGWFPAARSLAATAGCSSYRASSSMFWRRRPIREFLRRRARSRCARTS